MIFKSRKATNEYAVLGVLYEFGPLTGFQIAEHLDWSVGRLYPVLARLETEERIMSFWEGKRQPRRRFYNIPRERR